MATPPERHKDAINVSTLKAGIRREFERVVSGQKNQRGSKKYLHLQKFIETRRQKKLEKRCTLDPSAQVSFPIENILSLMIMSIIMMIMILITMTKPTFDKVSILLFQPVDVSHIFVPDLHERPQKRLPKVNNMKRASEVRSVPRK